MKKTWIVVADSARARIFAVESLNAPLQELQDLAHSEAHLMERDMDSDRPGRGAGGGGEHHAMDTTSSRKEHEAQSFAHQVVQELEQARNQHQFAQLIIIAAPSFLGQIRDSLSEPLAQLVAYELDKDLSKMDISVIQQQIHQLLPSYAQ